MAYQKTNWVNEETPLNANNMNKIEDELESQDTRITNLESELPNKITQSQMETYVNQRIGDIEVALTKLVTGSGATPVTLKRKRKA